MQKVHLRLSQSLDYCIVIFFYQESELCNFTMGFSSYSQHIVVTENYFTFIY